MATEPQVVRLGEKADTLRATSPQTQADWKARATSERFFRLRRWGFAAHAIGNKHEHAAVVTLQHRGVGIEML